MAPGAMPLREPRVCDACALRLERRLLPAVPPLAFKLIVVDSVALEALRRSDADGALGTGLGLSRFCRICFRGAADLPAPDALNTEVVLCQLFMKERGYVRSRINGRGSFSQWNCSWISDL